ncbi:MAG: class I SAM-dependent methyltransferase [Nitrospiraceae bacterium]|nr:class I SAM-dependent methyltransferase [Nitrospiraceae bacterium]
MSLINKISRNIKFLKNLYRNRDTIRSLLKSDNFRFIRFAAPGHFYSPIPDFQEICSKSRYIFDRSATSIESLKINADSQIQLIESVSALYKEMPFPDTKSEEYRYYLDNPFFSYGDGIILYFFLRHFSPKRIIEVGSGFSSSEMLDINDLFLHKKVDFTFIEPFPDRLFTLLSEEDRGKVRVEVKQIQEVELNIFSSLEADDILFIDSSHVTKINSDVLHILFHILPQLKKGVLIHFHDVLWPFEYPKNWLEDGRAWNEAYILRAFLQYNQAFEILYFNSYMALHHTDVLEKSMPRILNTPSSKLTPGNTSLWIRKVL